MIGSGGRAASVGHGLHEISRSRGSSSETCEERLRALDTVC